MSRILARGTTAPEFTLRVTQDQYLSLADLRRRRRIMIVSVAATILLAIGLATVSLRHFGLLKGIL